MKKLALLIVLMFLFSLAACTGSELQSFTELREAFVARGEGVVGYEVDEIEEYEGVKFFAVRVCLNTDDAVTVDDYIWFEANVMYFEDSAEADAAYQQNQATGLGGTCIRKGNILMYWLTGDEFADLYQEVFTNVLG
ncbi:MAG: hypothetical protein IJC19_08800 [Clostridia bacterium]|nr:hypothetical protein [Clostridia bacterium]